MNTRTTRLPQDRVAAFWSLVQFALFVGTMIVLGHAIGWPGILREPAGTILATIAAHPTGTLVGYWLYLADPGSDGVPAATAAGPKALGVCAKQRVRAT